MLDFWWQTFCQFSPGENRLKICHRKLHHILQWKKTTSVTWNSLWEHPRLKNKSRPVMRIGGSQKGGFVKGWFWRMERGNKKRNPGREGGTTVPKTRTRVHSNIRQTPFTKPPLLVSSRENIQCTQENESEGPLVYPYPKNTPNADHGLSFPSQKLRLWSEFLLSLVHTESGVVCVLLGPWSEFRPATS